MSEQFGPLSLNAPLLRPRAALPPRPPRFADRLNQQHARASTLKNKINPIALRFSQLPPAQRRAVFFKIKHENMRINLVGTDLRVFAEGDTETLATPKEQNLDRLLKKISDFDSGTAAGGHLKNEDLVFPMTDFLLGEPFDRLSEELLNDYDKLTTLASVIYEVELFANTDSGKREALELSLGDLQAAIGLNGTIFEYELVGEFARVVVRSSGQAFKRLVEEDEWQTRITRFEQRPKFETFGTTLHDFSAAALTIDGPQPNDPEICIVDSGITPGNPFLAPVCRELKFKSFVDGNSNVYDEYNHGSGVASLAAYPELNISAGATLKAGAWIVSARILDGNNHIETRLLSKVLADMVVHYAASGIQIFNLSVCVYNKQWNEHNRRAWKRSSWVARRIDQLSKQYNVVFVISCGNLESSQVNGYLAEGGDYPAYFLDDQCKILDPSQASLAVTVGSISPDSPVVSGLVTPVAERYCPSPFTRVGPGILGEIKPEVVDFGGNWVQTSSPARITTNPGTNIMMANNAMTPALRHHAATSFAAPKISYKLARILHDFKMLTNTDISASLLRALLINSCSIKRSGYEGDEIDQFAAKFTSVGSLARIIGYGTPDSNLAIFGNDYTVNCFYQGVLDTNQVTFFRIPIPAELVSSDDRKRLTITVAFAPEVKASGLKDYLGSRMQWRVFRGDASEQDVLSVMSEDDEEPDEGVSGDTIGVLPNAAATDELEETPVTKELKSSRYGLRQRSKGTVQHDVFEWKRHRSEYSQNDYLLAVSAYKRWSSKAVNFAVAIRLEDTSQRTPIYTKVQARLQELRLQAQVRLTTRQ